MKVLYLLFLYFCASKAASIYNWVQFSLATQRGLISSFTIDKAPLVATHNSYSSAIYDSMFLNQDFSITDQLELGVRWFELDTHYIPELTDSAQGPYRMCHASSDIYGICEKYGWNLCTQFGLVDYGEDTGCLPNTPSYVQIFEEIAAWKQQNPDEVIVIYFDDAIGDEDLLIADPSVSVTFNGWLQSIFNSTIYTPSDLVNDGGHWPTISSLASRGKTLVLTSSHATFGHSYVFDDFRGFEWPASKIMYFSGYPNCTSNYKDSHGERDVSYGFFQEDLSLVTFNGIIISNGTASVGAFNPQSALQVMQCQYSIFLDFIDAEHAQILVWSWAQSEPKRFSCGSMDYKTGNWIAEDCYLTSNNFACRSDSDFSAWEIGTVASPRDIYNPNDICRSGYSFSTPRTASENRALFLAVQSTKANVWISYNKYQNGTWSEVPTLNDFAPSQSGAATLYPLFVVFILAYTVLAF